MLSPSDSDDLPDVAHVLASQKNPSQSQAKRKRPPASTRHSSRRPPSDYSNPSSSRPRKKRKIQNLKVSGKARAASPIELTSENEPQRRNSKSKSKLINTRNKPPLAEVIDLCSDTEDVPRPTKKLKSPHPRAPPPQEGDIIVLLSSDNDDPGPSRLPDRAMLSNGVHHPLQQAEAQQLSVKRVRQEEEEGEEDQEDASINVRKQFLRQEEEEDEENTSDYTSETSVYPPPRKRPRRPSDSLSPMPTVQSRRTSTPHTSSRQSKRPRRASTSLPPVPSIEGIRRCSTPQVPVRQSLSPVPLPSPRRETELGHPPDPEEPPTSEQLPSPRQNYREVEAAPSLEVEKSTEPLQAVYNDLFRMTPDSEDDFTPCSAFPFRIRLPPHPATISLDFEPFDIDSPLPPLLTPSFFERARQALLSPSQRSRIAPTPLLQSTSRATSGWSEVTISNSESTKMKPRASTPDHREATLEIKATQKSSVELLEVSEALSPAADVATKATASGIIIGSRQSSPQSQLCQDQPQVANAVGDVVPADPLPIKDSTLESISPQDIRPTSSSSAEVPVPQANDVVTEEALTDSVLESTTPHGVVIPQVASSTAPSGSSSSLTSPALNQPELSLVNDTAKAVSGHIVSTQVGDESADTEVPPAAQPEVLVAAKVQVEPESTSVSVISLPPPPPPPPPPPILVPPVRPTAVTVEKPQTSVSQGPAVPLHPGSKETIPQDSHIPTVISTNATLSSPCPPSTNQMNINPIGRDNPADASVSPLCSSGSDFTNDNDMQEIADMLLTKSGSGSSSESTALEPTDEELLAIGLLYPDDDEWC